MQAGTDTIRNIMTSTHTRWNIVLGGKHFLYIGNTRMTFFKKHHIEHNQCTMFVETKVHMLGAQFLNVHHTEEKISRKSIEQYLKWMGIF